MGEMGMKYLDEKKKKVQISFAQRFKITFIW